MKIIVVGLGQTGTILADKLAQERHDVITIDACKENVDYVTDHYSVSGICGSGVSKQILLSAGAQTADVVLAMTPIDEVNLMVCMMAKNLGTRYAAARVFKPELSSDEDYLKKEFSVDFLINPKMETANEMIRQIGLPGLVKADAFFSDETAMIRLSIKEGLLPKDTMSILEIRQFFDCEMLIAAVTRDGQVLIPNGQLEIKTGDDIDIIASNSVIQQVVRKLGLIKRDAKNIFIIGGGDVAFYLASSLLAEKKQVTILDSSHKRCEELLAKLPDAKVCFADGLKAEVLLEEGIKNSDVSISLTGSDENNVILSLFAWSCGVPSILTKIASSDYEKLLNRVSIDITISPVVITVDHMLSFVRNVAVYNKDGNDIQSVHRLSDGKAEAIEFIAYKNCPYLNIPFKSKDFKLKKDLLITMILRNGTCIIPNGDSVIKENDHIVVITSSKQKIVLNTLNDIFH